MLGLVVAIFSAGLLLASAGNERIVRPFFAMHALWHVAGAFGFVALWAMNHVRFGGRQAPARFSSSSSASGKSAARSHRSGTSSRQAISPKSR